MLQSQPAFPTFAASAKSMASLTHSLHIKAVIRP
jgi:hypothetical protein